MNEAKLCVQAKQGIWLQVGRCSAISKEAEPLQLVTQKDKQHNHEQSPSFSSPYHKLLLLSMTHIALNMPLVY